MFFKKKKNLGNPGHHESREYFNLCLHGIRAAAAGGKLVRAGMGLGLLPKGLALDEEVEEESGGGLFIYYVVCSCACLSLFFPETGHSIAALPGLW